MLLHKTRKTAHRILVDLFGDAEAHIFLMRPCRGEEQASKLAPFLLTQPHFKLAFGAFGFQREGKVGNERLQAFHAALYKFQNALRRLLGQPDAAQKL